MILGFISLLLTFGQSYIVRICIPANVADKLLPCPYNYKGKDDASSSEEEHHRKLLSYERRYLSDDATPYQCKEVTKSPCLVFIYKWILSSFSNIYSLFFLLTLFVQHLP